MNKKIGLGAFALMLTLFTGQAHAQAAISSASCASLNVNETFTVRVENIVDVTVAEGDTLNVNMNFNIAGHYLARVYIGSTQVCSDKGCSQVSHRVTAAEAGTLRVSAAARGRPKERTGANSLTITCSRPVATDARAEAAKKTRAKGSVASVTGSLSSINGAINSALGGTTGSVTRNGLFLSTNGTTNLPKGWVALQGRAFDGDVDGNAYELTMGADWDVGAATRLGFLLSAGKSNLKSDGTDFDATALSFGPYFKTKFGKAYSLSGYAITARPKYDQDGTTYTADRYAAGLTVDAEYLIGTTEIKSHLGLSAFRELHPKAGVLSKNEITSVAGSIGARATFMSGQALRPFVSLGADFRNYDDGDGRVQNNSPRLGMGFSYDQGQHSLLFDVNGGEVLKDTRDLGFVLRYERQF